MSRPDPNHLRKYLRYDPKTGKLFWLSRSPKDFKACKNMSQEQSAYGWNRKFSGKEAFIYLDNMGYLRGAFLGASYRAHRVAWAIYYGEWPNGVIDHINRDRADNRLLNLRECSISDNSKNQNLSPRNTSSETGVMLDKRRNRWIVEIIDKGKRRYLGSFVDFDEARDVRRRAAIACGNRNGLEI